MVHRLPKGEEIIPTIDFHPSMGKSSCLVEQMSDLKGTIGGKHAPWRQWGAGIEAEAVRQMANACSLPVSVAGALMPDAHIGYGLPIGGVLATENAVIPYAVGVDIACRMKMTIFDCKGNRIAGQKDRLANLLQNETRFGLGASFQNRRDHEVMEENWSVSPVILRHRDKAWAQLGTSGTGNHFEMCPDGERAED